MIDIAMTSSVARLLPGQKDFFGWRHSPAVDMPMDLRAGYRHAGATLSVIPEPTPPAHQLLASSLESLGVGLEIWDEADRLVLYNPTINRLQANFHTPAHLGQTFETLERIHLQRHLFKDAIGQEEVWLAERLSTRARHPAPLLQALSGNRWVHLYETRTDEGCVMAAWVDVSDLMRREKMLEISNQHLVQQSVTDSLTGLANRRRFDEALDTEWLRAARSGVPLSLLMVDIDHFKNYNDRYGHLAGDQCLRRVAGALGQCVRRAGELVARYGGEEFVMLLPNADLNHACETAQNCLDRMHEEAVPHAASATACQVTLSVGVASILPDASMDATTLVNAADAAMYRAKSAGRARFEIANREDWLIDDDTPRTQPAPLV